MEIPKDLQDFLWEMSGAGDEEKENRDDDSDESFYSAKEDFDNDPETLEDNIVVVGPEEDISNDLKVLKETVVSASDENPSCELEFWKENTAFGGEYLEEFELSEGATSLMLGQSGKKRHRKKKKALATGSTQVYHVEIKPEAELRGVAKKMFEALAAGEDQKSVEEPKDASDNCLTIPCSSGKEKKIDLQTRLQLQYFAESKADIAREIAAKAREKCARDQGMSEVDIQYQVRRTAEEIEMATCGDYTLGDTFDDIEFFQPGRPGYTEAGVFRRPSLAVFEELLRMPKDNPSPAPEGTCASGMTPAGCRDGSDSEVEPDDADKFVKVRVCKGRFTRRVLKSSITPSMINEYEGIKFKDFAGTKAVEIRCGIDEVAPEPESEVDETTSAMKTASYQPEPDVHSFFEKINQDISRKVLEHAVHPNFRSHPCRDELDGAECLNLIRNAPQRY